MGSLVSHRQIFLEVTVVWNDRERPGNAEERSLILCRGAGRITSRASSVQWKDGSTSLAKIHTTSFSGCAFSATTSTASKKRCHKRENHGNGSNGSHSFIPSCHFFGGSNRQGQNCLTGLLVVDFVFENSQKRKTMKIMLLVGTSWMFGTFCCFHFERTNSDRRPHRPAVKISNRSSSRIWWKLDGCWCC